MIEEYVDCLKNDGVLAYPTDTVYGLCVRFDHQAACEHLRNVKHRPLEKSFPIMVSDVAQLKLIAEVNEDDLKLVARYMPGPITLILKKKRIIEPWMNDGKETIAVRMACDETLKAIIDELQVPIFMTSANKSGEPVLQDAQSIAAQLAVDKIYVGKPKGEKASTIVDCVNGYKVVREGVITQKMIDETIGG
ncbi:MAG: threonylcarbamoyl-AMP synthase [Erysipelotrichaceae bacterium]|nr:threonylcarbamoyl-AMP synthase [Erysipelotrichaceae bacterium]MDY5251542.1 L-threonylcarbamoyladenylate synthase [Erysipelotrichaceae bacterium]